MNNWENNIIAEKLNSLQHLPEGYIPNLISKWEIVEAGLPKENKKITPLFKWSVAAAITIGLIIGSWFVYFSFNKKGTGLPLIAIGKTTDVITNKTNLQPERTTNLITSNIAVKNKIIPVVSNLKSIANKKELNRDLITNVLNAAIGNKNSFVISSPVSIAAPTLITINNPSVNKMAKHKTYQKDFNDNIFSMDTGSIITQSQHASFKIQFQKNAADNNAQPSSATLQLQKSF